MKKRHHAMKEMDAEVNKLGEILERWLCPVQPGLNVLPAIAPEIAYLLSIDIDHRVSAPGGRTFRYKI
jgi:hypothetical protein